MARVPRHRHRQLPRHIAQGIQSDLRGKPQVNSGAGVYMTLSKQWMEAARIKADANGRPEGDKMASYIMALVAMILVSGMMRHTFALSGIETFGQGLVSGFGIGLFFISP
ncbi:DUF1761 family protein [Octadecabacter arcticus]|uniref:DUF1761 family protein n=1 Tax=Octadecabacter arcticus TaxID=53946 RepID=UPI0023B86122|nr:DUF1761 family protein [Octadecabacter arcticus]